MGKFEIICETNYVSRGTVKERKSVIEESFEKYGDAEFYLQKICSFYRMQLNRQLDDRIKSIDYKGKYLGITIDNSKYIETKLYYICKRMM